MTTQTPAQDSSKQVSQQDVSDADLGAALREFRRHFPLQASAAWHYATERAKDMNVARELQQPPVAQGASDVDIAKAQNCIHKIGSALPNLCLRCGWDWYKNGDIPEHPEEAAARKLQQVQPADVWESYKTWPADIRAKLSCHDLRRMSGWAAKSPIADWRIDTSAGGPILVYQNCSVIESEQAQYVLNLIAQDQQAELQQAQVVGADVARLMELVYVPGAWRCPKCSLRLIASTLSMGDGGIYANNEPQECANGCGSMWRVTEREDRQEAQRFAIEQAEALTTPQSSAPVVGDEMVERAARAYCACTVVPFDSLGPVGAARCMEHMKTVLIAALGKGETK